MNAEEDFLPLLLRHKRQGVRRGSPRRVWPGSGGGRLERVAAFNGVQTSFHSPCRKLISPAAEIGPGVYPRGGGAQWDVAVWSLSGS